MPHAAAVASKRERRRRGRNSRGIAVVGLPWGTLTEIRDLWEPLGFRRRALSFVGFGLIASASGLALIALDSDSDPRRAFEVALVQTSSVATAAPMTSAEAPLVHATRAREIRDLDGVTLEIEKGENPKSCPGTPSYEAENRCGSGAASNPGMAAPLSSPSNRDMAAPVSGRPPLSVIPTSAVENTPTAEVNATPSTDAGPAGVEAPALEVPATTERKTVRQQNVRRHADQQSSAWFDSRPGRGRYAQQRHFWPFW